MQESPGEFVCGTRILRVDSGGTPALRFQIYQELAGEWLRFLNLLRII